MSAVVRAIGLSRRYGRGAATVHALQEASLELHAGELVAVRGPSGSGKTTLLNLLGGLDTPDEGRVWIGDRELTAASEDELVALRRDSLGYVFQTFALIPVLTAAENIDLPLRIRGVERSLRGARVAELLDVVGLSAHAQQRPGELSGGQQQRLGIARALAGEPVLLIADEPTGQLDSVNAEAMMTLIASLVHERGIAAIVSTHDPRMAAHADRIIDVRDGRIAPSAPRTRREAREARSSTGAGSGDTVETSRN